MYYKVLIDLVGKPVGVKGFDDWQRYNTESKLFASLQEMKAYIKENYGGKSRQKMYQDNKDGSSHHVGYIYKMGENWDISHGDRSNKWYEQHWVACTEVKETPIII
jgi:hypothetical protein